MVTKNIPITQDMKQAAKNVFMAMAFTQTIKPIVEGYQHKILNEMQFKDKYTGDIITNPFNDYLMSADDFNTYLRMCNYERIKAGLKVKSAEYCPLLVAEDLQRQAERVFVETMEPITHLTADKVLCSKDGLANYKKLIDLSLRLLAPYIDKKL
jgi:hypothetical protein